MACPISPYPTINMRGISEGGMCHSKEQSCYSGFRTSRRQIEKDVYGFSTLRTSQISPDTIILSQLQTLSFINLISEDLSMVQYGISRTAIAILLRYMIILWELISDQLLTLLKSIQSAQAIETENTQRRKKIWQAIFLMIPL